MSRGEIWLVIALCAATTFAIKAAGPVALGGRELPRWFASIIKLMAPALLSALVAVAVFAHDDEWTVGADTAGVAVAGVLLWRGANVVVGGLVAAGITALLRAL
ncbi:MAG TPA: AzlD domain-containing protein [Solirubrobacteraceae bacterium]|jgi:branched-subunit amino acid transport protein